MKTNALYNLFLNLPTLSVNTQAWAIVRKLITRRSHSDSFKPVFSNDMYETEMYLDISPLQHPDEYAEMISIPGGCPPAPDPELGNLVPAEKPGCSPQHRAFELFGPVLS